MGNKYIFNFSVITPEEETVSMNVSREHFEEFDTQLDFFLEAFRQFLVLNEFVMAENARLELISEK